jgi:hypothetical protein
VERSGKFNLGYGSSVFSVTIILGEQKVGEGSGLHFVNALHVAYFL